MSGSNPDQRTQPSLSFLTKEVLNMGFGIQARVAKTCKEFPCCVCVCRGEHGCAYTSRCPLKNSFSIFLNSGRIASASLVYKFMLKNILFDHAKFFHDIPASFCKYLIFYWSFFFHLSELYLYVYWSCDLKDILLSLSFCKIQGQLAQRNLCLFHASPGFSLLHILSDAALATSKNI